MRMYCIVYLYTIELWGLLYAVGWLSIMLAFSVFHHSTKIVMMLTAATAVLTAPFMQINRKKNSKLFENYFENGNNRVQLSMLMHKQKIYCFCEQSKARKTEEMLFPFSSLNIKWRKKVSFHKFSFNITFMLYAYTWKAKTIQ